MGLWERFWTRKCAHRPYRTGYLPVWVLPYHLYFFVRSRVFPENLYRRDQRELGTHASRGGEARDYVYWRQHSHRNRTPGGPVWSFCLPSCEGGGWLHDIVQATRGPSVCYSPVPRLRAWSIVACSSLSVVACYSWTQRMRRVIGI